MTRSVSEFNFDGLVGPTHNYAGLSEGNLASARHRQSIANPRAAALQGLEKMAAVAALGVGQAILPPLRRPRIELLRELGMAGSDREVIQRAASSAPELLAACYSASNMWAANAATVSPAADCRDGRLHLTVANLATTLHRSIEAQSTLRVVSSIFHDRDHFAVHGPLPGTLALCDEGAANHTRFCQDFGEPGVELFVFGRSALNTQLPAPAKYPARQTLESVQAIARRHGLADAATVFAQQAPLAIDGGVFHNDVIAVGHRNVLLCHELAWVDQANVVDRLRRQFQAVCGGELSVISITAKDLPLADAVQSYLFNSQILTRADGQMILVCPSECAENPAAARCLEKIVAGDNPIVQTMPLDLRQSMQNGGGPACLRLRMVLDEAQEAAVHPGVNFTPERHQRLKEWVQHHYRDRLAPGDLADPQLMDEVAVAFESLAKILDLPADVLLDSPAN